MRIWPIIAVTAIVVSGCVAQLEEILQPEVDFAALAASTVPLDASQQQTMNGVYDAVQNGGNVFGDTVTVRWDGEGLSILSVHNVTFCYLRGGFRDDTVVVEGFWRFARGSQTGVLRLRILPDEGGRELRQGKGTIKDLTLRGYAAGPRDNQHRRDVVLTYSRKIKDRLRRFDVIAHRGGARNSDRLGFSENTVEMLRYASQLGATGVEIDILLTKDKAPIVFHDENFTPRTVQGAYLLGPVSNYTVDQIKTLARLVNGEHIPTLEEALATIITETNLRLVWLDVKSPEAVDTIIRAQIRAQAGAKAVGRDITFYLGLPTQDVYDAYMAHPLRAQVSTLCELDIERTRAANSAAWAPRWTLGVQADNVKAMQREGRRCFVWTLDDPAFIAQFLAEGDYDGILTNYPSLIASIFYAR